VEAVVSLQKFTFEEILSARTLRRPALLFAVALALLAFLSACYSNNNSTSTGVSCPLATGNYSNASLPAGSQWAYQLSGFGLLNGTSYSPYVTAGTFTVDGKGNITAGFDEFLGGTFTGTYSVTNNGTGSIAVTLNSGNNSGVALSWAMTLDNTSPGSIYVIEADPAFNSSGVAYQQTSTALGSVPSGTFVFHTHVLVPGAGLSGSSATVGVITVNAGTIASLNDDVVAAGVPTQRTLGSGTFTFTTPDSTGRGSVSITDSQSVTTAFDYFVIDANNYLLFETDATGGGLGLGRMEAQTAPASGFAAATLTGDYVFGSRGDTTSSAAVGVNSVGQFSVDGAGNITAGSYDTVRDGSPTLGASITASGSIYTVQPNGRTTITLSASGTPVGLTAYMVSGKRGFFLVSNDVNRVEDGTLEQQSAPSFSGSDFKGQSAFVMGGAISGSAGAPIDRTGTVNSDGNGNLGWAEVVNSGGSINTPGCLSGTYTVATNGRVAASVTSLSVNLVFYMVSPTKAYVLQGDSQTEVYGGATLQSSPVTDPPGAF
jgi:hypothetical protein